MSGAHDDRPADRPGEGLTVLVNAGPWLPVPPPGYGGIETVVATLVPELRRLGVRVVLAGVGTSTLEVDGLISALPDGQLPRIAAPYNQSSGIAHAHMGAVLAALRADPTIDLVHDHLEVVGPAVLAAMGPDGPPVLQTLHWDLTKHAEFYGGFDGAGRVWFAGVSADQVARAPAPLRAQTVGVVPLAVPPAPPRPSASPGPRGHALVLARITRDKGQDIAVRVCRAAGHPLVLAGPVAGIGDPGELTARLADPGDPLHSHPDAAWFRDDVAPGVDGVLVRWVGEVGGPVKERLLAGARVLLAPNRWAEPGATGVVEALGRGVPVVATPLGVLPSLVTDGVTGFLARDEPGLVAALGRVDELDPAACVASVAAWTPAAMARRYLELYREVISRAAAARQAGQVSTACSVRRRPAARSA